MECATSNRNQTWNSNNKRYFQLSSQIERGSQFRCMFSSKWISKILFGWNKQLPIPLIYKRVARDNTVQKGTCTHNIWRRTISTSDIHKSDKLIQQVADFKGFGVFYVNFVVFMFCVPTHISTSGNKIIDSRDSDYHQSKILFHAWVAMIMICASWMNDLQWWQ